MSNRMSKLFRSIAFVYVYCCVVTLACCQCWGWNVLQMCRLLYLLTVHVLWWFYFMFNIYESFIGRLLDEMVDQNFLFTYLFIHLFIYLFIGWSDPTVFLLHFQRLQFFRSLFCFFFFFAAAALWHNPVPNSHVYSTFSKPTIHTGAISLFTADSVTYSFTCRCQQMVYPFFGFIYYIYAMSAVLKF
jgi:hypothetical protein